MTPPEDYRLIPLTQGQFAKVSPHRFEKLSQRKWHALWHDRKQSFYAKTNLLCDDGKWRVVHMHRIIMAVLHDPSIHVDHINGDSLDNRDGNLRICTGAQNAKNRRNQRNSVSGYKGVGLKNCGGKYRYWCARITVDGKTISLGFFPDKEAAARAYDAAAIKYHGEFACLNFPHT